MDFNEQLNFMVKMAGSAECFENLSRVKTDELHFESNDTETVAIVGKNCRYVVAFNFETCSAISKRLAKIKTKQPKKVKQKPVEIAKKSPKKATKPRKKQTKRIDKQQIKIAKTDFKERLRLAFLYIKRQIA